MRSFAILHSVSHLLAMQLHRFVSMSIECFQMCSPMLVLQLLDPMHMCLIRSLLQLLATQQL